MNVGFRLLLVLLLATAVGSVWLVEAGRLSSPVGWHRAEFECNAEYPRGYLYLCLSPDGRVAFFCSYRDLNDYWRDRHFEGVGTWTLESKGLILVTADRGAASEVLPTLSNPEFRLGWNGQRLHGFKELVEEREWFGEVRVDRVQVLSSTRFRPPWASAVGYADGLPFGAEDIEPGERWWTRVP